MARARTSATTAAAALLSSSRPKTIPMIRMKATNAPRRTKVRLRFDVI
jgi:hypothetical protein